MIVLNFSHPLTVDLVAQLEALIGERVERVITVPCHVDVEQELVPQVIALADACGLSPQEWQTLPLLVNPPSLNFIAVALLAELHGRCGYFPAHLRLRPVSGSVPHRYEVAVGARFYRAPVRAHGHAPLLTRRYATAPVLSAGT